MYSFFFYKRNADSALGSMCTIVQPQIFWINDLFGFVDPISDDIELLANKLTYYGEPLKDAIQSINIR